MNKNILATWKKYEQMLPSWVISSISGNEMVGNANDFLKGKTSQYGNPLLRDFKIEVSRKKRCFKNVIIWVQSFRNHSFSPIYFYQFFHMEASCGHLHSVSNRKSRTMKWKDRLFLSSRNTSIRTSHATNIRIPLIK